MSEHSHVRVTRSAVTFGILGALELVFGSYFHNPAVVAIGGHDLFGDTLSPILVVFVSWLAIRIEGHFRCQGEVWAGFIVGVGNILLIGVLAVLTAPKVVTYDLVMIGLIAGTVSLIVNFYWWLRLRPLEHEGSHMDALAKHFRLDAIASGIVAFGGVIAYLYHTTWIALLAAVLVLAITLWDTVPDLISLSKRFHRRDNHPL